jgi:hypothetical protein
MAPLAEARENPMLGVELEFMLKFDILGNIE